MSKLPATAPLCLVLCASPIIGSNVLWAADGEHGSGRTSEDSAARGIDYHHEVTGSLGYRQSTGSLKAEGAGNTQQTTTIKSTAVDLSLQYGYLLGDHAEPFVEFTSQTTTETIGSYTDQTTATDYGFGGIFNLPVVTGKVARNNNLNSPLFSNSTFIPYGGFLLSSTAGSSKHGSSGELNTKDSDLTTRLIFGARYVPVPHVALNFSLRVTMQSSSSVAQNGDKAGGSTAKTTVDARLLAISLLF